MASADLKREVAAVTEAKLAAMAPGANAITYRLLGALAPNQDLSGTDGSQAAADSGAVYDARNQTLYILQSSVPYTPWDRAVIAYEYTHALQDQYYGLASLLSIGSNALGYDTDALLAHSAVVEGDAYTTMLSFVATFSRQDQVTFNQELQQPAPAATGFAEDRIGFPVEAGTNFVKYVMGAAAKGKQGAAATSAGLAAVDQALENPPSSTQDVLQPALYVQHAPKSDPVPVPEVSLGTQWVAVSSDVLGAFAIGDAFSQHAASSATMQAASRAATAWLGDRWTVYQSGGETLWLWHGRFATPAGAHAFEQALLSSTASRFHTSLRSAAPADWHTTGFAVSVRDHGSDVVVAIGSDAALLPQCVKALQLLGFS